MRLTIGEQEIKYGWDVLSIERLGATAGLLSLGLLISAGYLYRKHTSRKVYEIKKRELIARSFLSWFALGADHTPDHVTLAETVFLGAMTPDPLTGYELMGYFQKDLQVLDYLDERRKLENGLPDAKIDPGSLQHEYLIKYATESRAVLERILEASNSQFFRHYCHSLIEAYLAQNSALADHSSPTAS